MGCVFSITLSPLLPSPRAAASKAQAEHPSAFSGLYLPHLPFHRNSPHSAATVHGILSRAAATWREQPWEARGLVGEPSILQVIAVSPAKRSGEGGAGAVRVRGENN